ncbi:MAG: hypothetical protein JST16_01170 [Bdellovibrionales bacterium]|nr:hypothetical protein [Bdellovibrionales bacterium]
MTTLHRIFLLGVFMSFTAFAGHEKGNGGDCVILRNEEILLIDFFEGSLTSPKEQIAKPGFFNQFIWQEIRSLSGVHRPFFFENESDTSAAGQLTAALSRIQTRDPNFVKAFLDHSKRLNWAQTNESIPAHDDFLNADKIDALGKRIGCANALRDQIWLAPESDRLSPIHQAGLYFHEVVYWMQRTKYDDRYANVSDIVRLTTRWSFSDNINALTPDIFGFFY